MKKSKIILLHFSLFLNVRMPKNKSIILEAIFVKILRHKVASGCLVGVHPP